MTKYATKHFLEHKDSHRHKVAFIHLSSIASDITGPFVVAYGASKRFNEVFGRQTATAYSKSDSLKDLVDTQIVKPSYVTTPLLNNAENKFTVKPPALVSGSLGDLGS